MEAVTLTVAAIASTLIFFGSPVHGLVVFIAVSCLYPRYLAVSLGTIDFTASRIVIMVLFIKLFLMTDLPRRFKFIWLDKLLIVYFAAQFLASITTARSLMAFLENWLGSAVDMVLPYFAVRMIIIDRQKYLATLKWIFVIAAPLALAGFYQCMTGVNPVGFFRNYYAWSARDYFPRSRFGLMRADVVFEHSIMYGLFFSMFGPACAGVMGHVKKHKILYWIGLGLMCLGLFSCLSSGPALAALLSIGFLVFFRFRRYWKAAIISIVIMCGLIEVISNRHFYDVIDRFTLSSATAYYRSRLIDVALYEGGMSGHWITGYGYDVDPGWGPKIDRRSYTDMVNYYLSILSRYGLVGLIPFFAICIEAIRRLIHAYKISICNADEWIIWCLGAVLFGMAAAMGTVSLHDNTKTIFYVIIAFCGVMPMIVRYPQRRRVAPKDVDRPAID